MSPERNTTRLSAWATVMSSSAKAFLMTRISYCSSPVPAHGRQVHRRRIEAEFLPGRADFVGRRNSVVPVVVIFHERYAATLDGVADQGGGLARRVRQVFQMADQCRQVVAV